jgi:hypothetical protein
LYLGGHCMSCWRKSPGLTLVASRCKAVTQYLDEYRLLYKLTSLCQFLTRHHQTRTHLVLTITIRTKLSTLPTAPYIGEPLRVSGFTTSALVPFSLWEPSTSNGFICNKFVIMPRSRCRSSIPSEVQARASEDPLAESLLVESACLVGVPETAQNASEDV